MRIIRAFKTLYAHYWKIIPTFLIVFVLTHYISNLIPIIGMAFLLPLKVSVFYTMLIVTTKPKKHFIIPIHIGFKKDVYLKNVFYLSIQQILYLAPILIGTLISAWIYQHTDINLPLEILIVNLIVFAIPTAIMSLTLSMVPFLLADPKFNQAKKNPLKESAHLLKGSYIKLMLMRLIFIPWFLWFSSGFIVTLLSTYNITFGQGESIFPWLSISWLISIPVKLLLIDPLYQLMHADLYVSLKKRS